jgi:hypothetical protein
LDPAVDDLLNELSSIILRLEDISKVFEEEPLHGIFVNIDLAAESVGKSSSNSWHGYQSSLYLKNFKISSNIDHFNTEWGFQRAMGNTTRGEWIEYAYGDVESEILRRAKVAGLEPLKKAASDAEKAFHQGKGYLLPLLDVVIYLYGGESLKQLKEKASELDDSVPAGSWISRFAPKMLATRDPRAQSEFPKGPNPPPTTSPFKR